MLELKGITKSYRTKDFSQDALKGVSLSFRRNEFAAILGASGSGKTTLLNIIGGLDRYDRGELIIDGVLTKNYKAADWDMYRNNRIGFVFQNYNLITHQSVLANVELALTLSGISKRMRRQRALQALDEVGLADHVHKLPTQLSGGQMQRVAIARALINNPEIVLADEPTGALDSATSGQVMKLLEEIAQDRLVIMVTHNAELAHQYTNRIIELKDGHVVADSHPHKVEAADASHALRKETKTSMSFLTAVALSLSNLKTKKGRTFITSLAGSIGIIGIAAILALASGINLYIKDIEQETMSAYPLSINASGIDISSFMSSGQRARLQRDDSGELPVIDSISSLFSHRNQNDLQALKTYLDSQSSEIAPYVKSIQYKYNITPQIYLEKEVAAVRQVNPDVVFSTYGIGDAGGLEMFAGSSDMGMTSFNELPGDTALFQDQYEVVAGRWPQKENEALVVLTSGGSMTDITAYALGLKDRVSLWQMFEGLMQQDKEIVLPDSSRPLNYEDILEVSFKVVQPAAKYIYDANYGLWVDKSEDEGFMDKVIAQGIDLPVVGVVRASDSTRTPVLSSGIYYPQALSSHLIGEAVQYDIVRAQLNNPRTNVFTGKNFDEPQGSAKNLFNMENLLAIDYRQLQRAFNLNSEALMRLMDDLEFDLSQIELPPFDLAPLAESIAGQINVPWQDIGQILNLVWQDFMEEVAAGEASSWEEWIENATGYWQSESIQNKLQENMAPLLENSQVVDELVLIIQNYLQEYLGAVLQETLLVVQQVVMEQIAAQLTPAGLDLGTVLAIDSKALAQAFKFTINEEDMFDLIRSLGESQQSNQASNLKALGYRDLSDPVQINIYPKDFNTKDDVVAFLDNYNAEMEAGNQAAQVVKYSDFIGALMSSVTTIIDTISYALIAFVSISLIVSSIMIGVITYVSVLERIKEIGILRAIGARKKDIRRVFNAETLIIGFMAGSIGIIITYGVSLVASFIVYRRFNIPNIAHLQGQAAAILIVISMFLAYISGLLPASSAANKDPVEALRSE